MHDHSTKKLRFGCGAALNSSLPKVGRKEAGKKRLVASAKVDANKDKSVIKQSSGYKQE